MIWQEDDFSTEGTVYNFLYLGQMLFGKNLKSLIFNLGCTQAIKSELFILRCLKKCETKQ